MVFAVSFGENTLCINQDELALSMAGVFYIKGNWMIILKTLMAIKEF